MANRLVMVAAACVAFAGPAATQPAQPSAEILAQAYDRCMATFAVRLTKTAASDEEIYNQAMQSCATLGNELKTAIGRQFPSGEAGELLQAMDAQSKPNFLEMLARIRRDRAARAGE